MFCLPYIINLSMYYIEFFNCLSDIYFLLDHIPAVRKSLCTFRGHHGLFHHCIVLFIVSRLFAHIDLANPERRHKHDSTESCVEDPHVTQCCSILLRVATATGKNMSIAGQRIRPKTSLQYYASNDDGKGSDETAEESESRVGGCDISLLDYALKSNHGSLKQGTDSDTSNDLEQDDLPDDKL